MPTGPHLMTAGDYLEIIARRWYFLVIPVVIAVTGAIVLGVRDIDTYRAEARVVASLGTAGGDTVSVDADANRQIATEIEVMRSQSVKALAAAANPQLGPLPAPSVATAGTSNVLVISVIDVEAERAAAVANAYALAYLEYSRKTVSELVAGLESRIDELGEQLSAVDSDGPAADALGVRRTALAETLSGLDLVVARQAASPGLIQPAVVPPDPITSSAGKRIAAAGIVGLLAGLALVGAFEIFAVDRRHRGTVPASDGGSGEFSAG